MIGRDRWCDVKGHPKYSTYTICFKSWETLLIQGYKSKRIKRYCEAACSAHEHCVGYNYSENDGGCWLTPSIFSCPAGFEFQESLPPKNLTAPTSNDLVAGRLVWNGIHCYAKNLGKVNLPRFYS